jgi:Ca-activated chloride channel family protein
MRFGDPRLLWLLLAVPAAVLGYAVSFQHRRRLLARLGEASLVRRMAADVSVARKVARAAFVVAAVALAALALARPQAGGRAKVTRQQGLDMIVALDFSKSMLAKDVYPSRLERAKRELERLMDHLAGDRVGLVAFAGETLGYPPTTDYAAVKLFWRDLSPWDMPVGGTALGRAIQAGTEVLTRLRAREGDAKAGSGGAGDRAQVILLLTDGEDTESEPLDAADAASKLGIKIFTIGIGSRSGELIPTFDEHGQVTGYVQDADGKYVTSRLGEDTLIKIAQKTGGEYLHADTREFGVERLEAALANLKRTENEARVVKEYDDVYEGLVLPAFLLLVGEACMSDRRRGGRSKKVRGHAKTSAGANAEAAPPAGVVAKAVAS